MTETTVSHILHRNLDFHPYKMMIVQHLNEEDYPQCAAFVERMLEILKGHENGIIMMSEETHFHLNGAVNKQNC